MVRLVEAGAVTAMVVVLVLVAFLKTILPDRVLALPSTIWLPLVSTVNTSLLLLF